MAKASASEIKEIDLNMTQQSLEIKEDNSNKIINDGEKNKKKDKLNREDIKHRVLTTSAKMYLKPHKGDSTKDYLKMVREVTNLKDEPVWDKSRNTLTQSMIESRRNLFTSQKLLDEKRLQFSKYCQLRDKQIADLTEKEKKLQESFVFFDEFVKENIEKRERAAEKIAKEKEEHQRIVEEIEKINVRLVTVNKLKENMIQSIEENKIFQDYLIRCGKSLPNIFSPIPEKIIERYQLLMDVRNELARLQWEEIEQLQNTSKEIDQEADDRSEQLIDLNNLLTDLYNRKQVASQEVQKWKYILNKLQAAAAELELETEQAQAACDDLYQEVCRETGRPHEVLSGPDKNSEQLRVILERILELHQILKVAHMRDSTNYSDRPNSCMSRPSKEHPKPRTRP